MLGKYSKLCFAALCALFFASCVSALPPGSASFTILSDQTDKTRKHYAVVGEEVKEKECFSTLFYLIGFGTMPVEEALLSKVLDENSADALIDAELKHSFVSLPLIFQSDCVSVSGIPVKLKGAP